MFSNVLHLVEQHLYCVSIFFITLLTHIYIGSSAEIVVDQLLLCLLYEKCVLIVTDLGLFLVSLIVLFLAVTFLVFHAYCVLNDLSWMYKHIRSQKQESVKFNKEVNCFNLKERVIKTPTARSAQRSAAARSADGGAAQPRAPPRPHLRGKWYSPVRSRLRPVQPQQQLSDDGMSNMRTSWASL